ncbi:MAG: M20/M25/M40 family metallo-hydrolase [Sandaracinaceae bacterium]
MDLDLALERSVNGRFEAGQVAFLERLVAQPSCSREPDDVEAAAQLVEEKAASLGLACLRVPDPEGRHADHRVLASGIDAPDRESLALVGHVDTVFPRSLGFFGFRREGTTAMGPGVLDMKSGLSSIFFALEALRDVMGELPLPVRVIVNSDEEVGSPSSAPLFARLAPHLSSALVFEAGRDGDEIVVARKGAGAYELRAVGRAAHSGLDHASGINAIEALSLAIPAIGALTDHARGLTFNVGLIDGGSSANTVPEHARCSIDVRATDPETAADGERQLRETIASIALNGRLSGARLILEGRFHRPPMVVSDASLDLCARYGAHARVVGLSDRPAPLQGGGSDANLLSAAGVPCIDGLGPAGSGIHRTDERCDLESLRRRTVALARFLAAEAG